MLTDAVVKTIRSFQVLFPRLADFKAEVRYRIQTAMHIPHEADFRILARFYPQESEVLIDVGANRGQSIESMLISQPRASIVAFEPNPMLWPRLERRYTYRPNVRVHPIGLSDTDSSVDLFVPSYRGYVFDGLASLEYVKASTWLEQRLWRFDSRHLRIEKYTVNLVPLDALKLKPAFIKIDVQGTELNVVRGGRDTIRNYLPVFLIESVEPSGPISRLLHEFGYGCYAFRDGKLHRDEKGSLNSFLINRSVSRFDPSVFAQ